jgi:cytoskeletal protein CcmA (bactofilin family)
MGFFKDFKDDLSQAVNELLPEEVLEENKEANTANSEAEVTTQESGSLETEQETETLPETEEDDNVDMEILDAILTQEDNTNEETTEDKSESNEDPSPEPKNEELEDDDTADYDEVTVITKGTVISGSINAKGSMEIMGTIKGDIECQGKLSIIGLVQGNCMASEVYVGAKRYEGCITSEGSVKIGLGTVIIGDIAATSGVIAGAVKGDIDVTGPIIIDSSAVIKGNIKAQSIQINNGAVVEGFCSLSYASIDIDNIFE